MGQKVHPNGIRLGIVKPWNSTWFANTKEFADNLDSDFKVRQYLTKELAKASVSRIVIERPAKSIRVTIHTARPGIVIGKKGEDVEKLRKVVADIAGVPAQINIAEVRKPELDAKLVADSITSQLERRVMFRRAMKRAVQNAMRLGAKGIKVEVSGRLGGAEIARSESYHEGTIPLQTIRADIEYGFAEAATTFGRIGVKVWIYKGEVLSQTLRTTPRTMDTSKPYQERRERRPRRDGDRRGGFGGDRRNGGFNRDRQGGFNRQGGAERRPQGGFRPNTNRPAAPAAPAKEGGAN